MRRKRKSRGTWFPTIGTFETQSAVNDLAGFYFTIPVAGDGTTTMVVAPITFDTPHETEDASAAEEPLVDFIGNEYILRRIVGKCFAGITQERADGNDPSSAPGALFCSAFFVARAGDSTDNQLPIGMASETDNLGGRNYDPLHPDCIREPWIWRRVWLLGNSGQIFGPPNEIADGSPTTAHAGFADPIASFPRTTAGYGSVADGPHIDAKTIRRVTSDDRLWWVGAVHRLPIDVTFENDTMHVNGFLDYRIFGSLRKARNRGNF